MRRYLVLIVLVVPCLAICQSIDTTLNLKALNEKYLGRIENNVKSFSNTIERKTLKSLRVFQEQEDKLKRKLARKDSLVSKQLFNAKSKYDELSSKLKNSLDTKKLTEYIPQLDSLKTAFAFLGKAQSLSQKLPNDWSAKVSSAGKSVQELESKLQQANEIKKFIKERKDQIREQLEKYNLGKYLRKYNKEVYYYQQQLNEHKAMLHDPKKIQQRAIVELRKLPAFTDFMKKNSQLARLFQVPENYGTREAIAGLQTRASIQNFVQARIAGSGVNPQQYVQQQMQQASTVLNKIKDKLNKLGGGSNDIDMPDFKPNNQKTKSFLKRIEYGANIQSQKVNGLLPSTSDLALTAGYKLNDKSIIGIGASYKLGWGNGIQHIKLSNQGVGLRSFLDIKIKGNVWMSGGYEQNYMRAFTKIEELKQFKAWQTSGLLGLTKKYKIGRKANNMQLLWDFMNYRQIPSRPHLIFRIGYKL